MPEVTDEPDRANSQLAASEETRRGDPGGIAVAYRNRGGGRNPPRFVRAGGAARGDPALWQHRTGPRECC